MERVFELRLAAGGGAVVDEPLAADGTGAFRAEGVWGPAPGGAPDEVRVSLTTSRGRPLAQPEVFGVAFVDGFPVGLTPQAGRDPLGLETLGFTLGSGDTHPLVRVLQTHLIALARAGLVPFPAEPPAGAVFDEATRRAVVAFQSARRLVPDGAVDAATWRALTEASPLRPVSLLRSPAAALPGAALPATTAQGQSIVYLTFDDGPNPPFTQGMLETLARYGAKATFFEVGQQVKAFPAVVREVASAGHYVANHTFDHHTLEGISRQNFVQEAQETRGLILDAAGSVFGLDHDVRYLRPPYGATDANTREFAAALGYTLVLWDVDPQDWRRPGTAQIASHVLSHVHPGAIVLMHDGGGPRDQSVAALDTILREIAAGGYVSHTIFDRFNGTPAAPGAPAAPAAPAGPGAPGTLRVTGTGGSGLNIHGAPSRSAPVVVAVTEGTVLTDLGGSQEADGLSWRQVRTAGGATGWAAAQFLAG